MRMSIEKPVELFLLKNDGIKLKIGDVNKTSFEQKVSNPIKIDSVNKFNEEVMDFIKFWDMSNNNYKQRKEFYLNKIITHRKTDELYGILIDIVFARRCTLFFIIQKSERGIRYLCYIYDNVNHSAGSFGKGIDDITLDMVKPIFKDSVKNYMEQLSKINEISTFLDIVPNIESNIDDLIGV